VLKITHLSTNWVIHVFWEYGLTDRLISKATDGIATGANNEPFRRRQTALLAIALDDYSLMRFKPPG
jgi:hypothetical protein